MPATAASGEDGRIEIKGDPIPTRYDNPEELFIRKMSQLTGLPISHIIRQCAKFALPKFASGEINILTLTNATALNGEIRKDAATP